jgi:ribosomal protein S18 acetylase RimI-like enzyme
MNRSGAVLLAGRDDRVEEDGSRDNSALRQIPERTHFAMIRPAFLEEADAVRLLVRAAYGRWIERLGREPSPMQDDYVERIADGEVWVLKAEGVVVGIVVLKDGPEALLIPNVAVAPAAQGRGHGRQLLAFAEKEATRRGYREIRLFVNALMIENIALYQHLGFAEIARVEDEGGDRAYLCMAKSVSS